jgi:hypothetical protein
MPPTMAATVPAELRTVFDRFYTTEYVTVAKEELAKRGPT